MSPVIVFFTTGDASIPAGSSATLSWSVEPVSATTLTISDSLDSNVGTVTGLTSAVVKPASTITYTLTATNSLGTATAKVTVSVIPAPVISSFATTPASPVPYGQSTTLSWNVSNETKLNLTASAYSSYYGSVQTNTIDVSGLSSYPIAPQAETTYTLQATNSAGVSVKSSPLVVDIFRLAQFTADTYKILSNGTTQGTANLSWSGVNVSSYSLKSVDTVTGATQTQTISTNSSQILAVSPAHTTNYFLTAYNVNNYGITAGPLTINVDVSIGAINSFLVNGPASASTTGSVNLVPVFNSTDGNGVSSSSYTSTILDDQGNTLYSNVVSGQSYTVTPGKSTTYTLTVSDGSGSQTKSVRVIVGELSVFSGEQVLHSATPSSVGSNGACNYSPFNSFYKSAPQWTPGSAASAELCDPTTFAADPNDNLYYLDAGIMGGDAGSTTFVEVDTSGNETLAAGPYSDPTFYYFNPYAPETNGTMATATFAQYSNYGTAFDASGNLYLSQNGDCTIRKITPVSGKITTTSAIAAVAGQDTSNCGSAYYGTTLGYLQGDLDGQGASAQFTNMGSSLIFDSVGDLIIGELCSIRAMDAEYNVATIAGYFLYDGNAAAGTNLSGFPIAACSGVSSTVQDGSGAGIVFGTGISSIAIDSNDVIYLVDGNFIRKLTPDKTGGTKASEWNWYLSTLTSTCSSASSSIDGPAGTANICPTNLMVDKSTNTLYTIDNTHGYIRRITPDGVVDSIAGSGVGYSAYTTQILSTITNCNKYGYACDYTPVTVAAQLPGAFYSSNSDSSLLDPVAQKIYFVPSDVTQIFALPYK